MAPPKEKTIQTTLIPILGKTMKHVNSMISARLNEAGLDLTKNQVILMKLIGEGPQPQSSLALITERDKGSLTRLIQSMERKRLVTRVASKEDGRVNLVKLTAAGKRAMEQAKPVMKGVFDTLQQGVTEKERQHVRRVLQRIMHNAEQDMGAI